jgi:NADH dehydrogenase [ubiquinone] 1 alpha subcomplex assembly factor 3
MHSPSLQLLRALRTSLTAVDIIPGRARRRAGNSVLTRSLNSGNPERLIPRAQPVKPSRTRDRELRELRSEEDTQTDFTALNVLGGIPAPATAVDSCLHDGFLLNNGVKVVGGDGVLLVAGEVFMWRPWEAPSQASPSFSSTNTNNSEGGENPIGMINPRGQFDVAEGAWGLFALVWPRPGQLFFFRPPLPFYPQG